MSEAIRMRPWKEQKEEYMELIRKEGIALGLKEGRTEGLRQGRTEGLRQGRMEGQKEGKVIGIEEGRERARKDLIINMIREGLDYQTIEKVAQVSPEEYEELKGKI